MNTIIIRPEYVWDTRSPMRKFVEYHKKENQIYWALMLTLKTCLNNWDSYNQNEPAVNIVDKSLDRQLKAFIESFGNHDNKTIQPSIKNLKLSIIDGINFVTEYSLISYLGEFEAYLQCWTLNLLLSKLEQGKLLTQVESGLITKFNPNINSYPPNTATLIKDVNEIKELLIALPHVIKDYRTKKKVIIPLSANLNAHKTIKFWKEWRNLVVHSSGIVSEKFNREYREFYDEFRSVFEHVPDFKINQKLKMNEAVFRAITTVHYNAALALKDLLVSISKEKRGHTYAPGPVINGGKYSPSQLPKEYAKMLIDGDHNPSLQYYLKIQQSKASK